MTCAVSTSASTLVSESRWLILGIGILGVVRGEGGGRRSETLDIDDIWGGEGVLFKAISA